MAATADRRKQAAHEADAGGDGSRDDAPQRTDPRQAAAHVGRGALMGAADVVPGVSGGTVALILGIHPRLVGAVAAFDVRLPVDAWRALRGDEDARRALARLDLRFVVPLGVGILLALWSVAGLVGTFIDARPALAMALFFGLIAGSLPVPWRHVESPRLIPFFVAAAAAAAVAFLPSGAWPTAWWGLALAGSIALVAMLLPGISGSALLVLMGVYTHVLDLVSARDILALLPFVAGGVLGLAVAARALRRLFASKPDATWSALTGLLAGSLVRVWPWRSQDAFGAGDPTVPGSDVAALLLFLVAAAGALLVRVIDRAGARRT